MRMFENGAREVRDGLTTFIAFPDCPACHGFGYTSRGYGFHGWQHQCEQCMQRFDPRIRLREEAHQIVQSVKHYQREFKRTTGVPLDPQDFLTHELAYAYRRVLRQWWAYVCPRELSPTSHPERP